MTDRSGTETRQREMQVGVRLTIDEWEFMATKAIAEGVSIPELMRRGVLDAQTKEGVL